MYALKETQASDSCTPDSFDNSTIVECQTFVYDTLLFPETLTTKLDLVRWFVLKKNWHQNKMIFMSGLFERVQQETNWCNINVR